MPREPYYENNDEPAQGKPRIDRVTVETRVESLADFFDLAARCQAMVPTGVPADQVQIDQVFTTIRGTKIKSVRLTFPVPDWTTQVQWIPPKV